MSTRTLEDRIRDIEDRLEIYNLIASHPPSADTGADFYARAVYADDGIFNRGDKPGGRSVDEYGELMTSAEHKAALEGGLGHFAGLPYLELDGDKATVTSYLQILTPDTQHEPVPVRTTAPPRASASIASQRTAGTSSARRRAGASRAAPCVRSTGRRKREGC